MIEDDRLTGAQQEALTALKASRGACPSAETLIEYEALDPDARPRHAAHDHIQVCSRCQLVLLHAAEPAATRAQSSLQWILPLAAVLVLGVAVTLVSRKSGPSGAPGETVRGAEIQAITPAGTVDAITAFTWQSPIRAERYRVTVRHRSDQVWQAETSGSQIAPPLNLLESGVEYRWQVEAIDREGDVRMTSPPRTFTLSRRR